jgi:hypothetical protein
VDFKSTGATNGCSYRVEKTFTVPRTSARLGSNRITFAQEPRNRAFVYMGVARAGVKIPVTWTCPNPDDSWSDQIVTGLWWSMPVAKPFRPGRPLRGASTLKDIDGIIRWSWNLLPAR